MAAAASKNISPWSFGSNSSNSYNIEWTFDSRLERRRKRRKMRRRGGEGGEEIEAPG